MSARRFTRFALITSMVLAAWASPRAASGKDCTVNDTVRVTLSKTGTGEGKIADGCWMPSVAAASKVLCAHDIEQPHTFTFVLTNDCAIAVKLKLSVKKGSIDFTDAACEFEKGNSLFDDFLSENGGTVSKTCSAKKHGNKGQKKGSYELAATHVRENGKEVKLGKDVTFDPEIIIEDNGKHPILFLAAIALSSIAVAYGLYRLLRRT